MSNTEGTGRKGKLIRSFRLDEDVMDDLVKFAERESRSVNNAANYLLRQALQTEVATT